MADYKKNTMSHLRPVQGQLDRPPTSETILIVLYSQDTYGLFDFHNVSSHSLKQTPEENTPKNRCALFPPKIFHSTFFDQS